jgi:hypothetical protein
VKHRRSERQHVLRVDIKRLHSNLSFHQIYP